jgi:pyruvate/2-oxoglutarate dehydrogenase complex dihydrolipoamide acyltransferase (E2) component
MEFPQLTQAQSLTTVKEWLIAAGDVIEVGSPVLSVETDKAVVEVESEVQGRVKRLFLEVGEEVQPGQTMLEVEEL